MRRWWTVVVMVACGTADPAVDPCLTHQAGEVVITELMLDPEGADTGAEWVELFNPASTPLDLTGLSLYAKDLDGSNAKTVVLPGGTVPPQGWYVLGDIRQGPNPPWINASYGDALGALGNARGAVGLRCGAVVLDEVSWTHGTRSGHSRMLGGGVAPDAIANDDEANWCEASDDAIYFGLNTGTPGEANPGCVPEASAATCFENGVARPVVSPGAGALVLTEVMTRPHTASTANGQWFEVLAQADVDLNGVTITNGSGASTTVTSPSCLRVTSGSYAVFARNADAFVNGGLPTPTVVYSLPLSTGHERLSLSVADAGIDALAILGSTLGHAWQLDPDHLDAVSNDDPEGFCRAAQRWAGDAGDFGSPGAPNPPCEVVRDGGPLLLAPDRCLDRRTTTLRALRVPEPGDLVISEWLANPSAVPDAVGEYVELFATRAVDLNALELADASGAHSTLASAWCLAVEAGAWAVVARDTNPLMNGNVPATATFGFTLNNTNESVVLRRSDGGVLDSVAFASSHAGASTQRARDGGVCVATTRVVLVDGGRGDLGTPGGANDCP